MALSLNVAESIARIGVFGSSVLTIGRLSLSFSRSQARRIIGRDYDHNGFAEPFLIALGAKRVDSLDISRRDGATIIADLTEPLPDDLEERWDLLVDGGTIEHTSSPIDALRSYWKLTHEGGAILISTGANNYLGHGFFQFNPRFFQTVFPWAAIALREDGMRVFRLFGMRIPIPVRGRLLPAGTDPSAWRTRNPVAVLVYVEKVGTSIPNFVPVDRDFPADWATSQTSTFRNLVDEAQLRVLPALLSFFRL